jgi:prevent-host-death family protein
MQTYNIHQAKTHLSELVALAERGEDIVIARANKPAVRLVPVSPQPKKRVAGLGAGTVAWVADDFDDYLPADFLITPVDWPAIDKTGSVKK